MSVGTKGEVKFVSMEDLYLIQAQAMLSNGYHLRNASFEIAENGGLASWSGWNGPTLTDSGGFQVMSLGSGMGKVVSMKRENDVINTDPKDRLAHVTEDGVRFHDPFTDQEDFIGPEESMQIQCRIGADIHMAYDELTSLADSYEYNVEALARTERWAIRSINEHKKHCDDLGYHQSLYGVLQGGRWEDLRRSTAKRFAEMDFDGYGLGGAFLKESLGDILRWCCEELPETKPRHLLGLSHPDDILIGTEMGADTFDCVAPTREARHGKAGIQSMALSSCQSLQTVRFCWMRTVTAQPVKPDGRAESFVHCGNPEAQRVSTNISTLLLCIIYALLFALQRIQDRQFWRIGLRNSRKLS